MPDAADERHQRVRRALQGLPAVQSSLPLASGDLAPSDAAELEELKTLITRHVGLDSSGYKERCLRRRIAVRMRARGLHRYRDYAALIERDTGERERLLDAVMINVSKFFRNTEVWDALRTQVLPYLFAQAPRRVTLWSAGCAAGEEPYSLAILLHEYAAEHRLSLDRFSVLGTDVDHGALAAAQRGEYTEYALTETSDETRERWFDAADGTYRVKPEVRALVRFAPLDLLRDAYPRELHLILCRNVIIYFERRMQDRIFEHFAASLVPSGFLVLGKVETLFGANAAGFDVAANRERIFRRL